MAVKPQSAVDPLAEQLGEGFAALCEEYRLLFDKQRQLESQLSFAKQQYLDLLKRFTPNTLSQEHLAFLQDLERVAPEPSPPSDLIGQLVQSEVIRKAESAVATVHDQALANGVKIWSGPSADKKPPATLSVKTDRDLCALEEDFTTTGTPSRLGCPFAASNTRQSPLATPRSSSSRISSRGRRSKRASFTDPIRAEICGNDLTPASASASVEGSAAVCPIRFLDQHKPEEVATYFEKHKHEIPRSHEVCIKRFQSNAESIAQLDRKYGNLVSMIQGLGEKHQPWLPKEPEDIEDAVDDAGSDQKVEKWAKAVTASLHDGTSEELASPEPGADETRTAHFDRPLKEVRVGESPSRPWGISIPAKYTNDESASDVGSVPTASPPLPIAKDTPVHETPQKAGKCPFDHKALGKSPAAPPLAAVNPILEEEQEAPRGPPTSQARPTQHERVPPQPSTQPYVAQSPQAPQSPSQPYPQMVFNGPVFLGYPPEQLMSILQNSNLGGVPR